MTGVRSSRAMVARIAPHLQAMEYAKYTLMKGQKC